MSDQRGVDLRDVADLADVDQVLAVVLVGQQQLFGANETAVLAGQAYRLAAGLIDQVDNVLVDLATEHHLDDFHRLSVGDAHALDEPPFLPTRLSRFSICGPPP
jgi:hypothetical protein